METFISARPSMSFNTNGGRETLSVLHRNRPGPGVHHLKWFVSTPTKFGPNICRPEWHELMPSICLGMEPSSLAG